MFNSKITSLTLSVLVMTFLIVLLVFAWTEPTVAPPGGNVDSPLNTGLIEQWKDGILGIYTDGIDTNYGLTVGNDTTKNKGIKVDGNSYIDGNLNMNSNKITNLASPSVGSDAANMQYVSAQVGGGTTLESKMIEGVGEVLTFAHGCPSTDYIYTVPTGKTFYIRYYRASRDHYNLYENSGNGSLYVGGILKCYGSMPNYMSQFSCDLAIAVPENTEIKSVVSAYYWGAPGNFCKGSYTTITGWLE